MAITSVSPVNRTPRQLKAWERELSTEMMLDITNFLGDKGYVFSEGVGESIVHECIERLRKYRYDMDCIKVVCDDSNNSSGRKGLWVELFIGFGVGDVFVTYAWNILSDGVWAPYKRIL